LAIFAILARDSGLSSRKDAKGAKKKETESKRLVLAIFAILARDRLLPHSAFGWHLEPPMAGEQVNEGTHVPQGRGGPEVRLMKESDRAAVLALKQRLQERFGRVELVVFGSKARGDDAPDSDIDVLIVLDGVTAGVEAEIDDLIYDVDLAHDCVISAVICSRGELTEGPLRQAPLLRAIEREGVPV